MKLLFSATAYPPSTGGAQNLHHLLAQQLGRRHEVVAISHWDTNRTDWLLGTTVCAPDMAKEYEIDGVPVSRMGLSRGEKTLLSVILPFYYPLMFLAVKPISYILQRKLQAWAADADLVHNVRIGREGISHASLEFARKKDIPFVLTPVHHPRWRGWPYRVYEDVYRRSDRVIALTGAEKAVLEALGVNEERIAVTGVGPVLAEEAYPNNLLAALNIDGPMVLFLGQHYRYKGFPSLLAAMPHVWQQAADTHFVFIGPPIGDSEKFYTGIDDHRVHRLGAVSLQEKTNAIAACTILCVPSVQESFGGVFTEAWSFGKPVIGGNIPPVADVISDGTDGYLVEQRPEQIADRLVDLLRNPVRAETMGAAGRRKVEERYQWSRLAELTEKVYADAAQKIMHCIKDMDRYDF